MGVVTMGERGTVVVSAAWRRRYSNISLPSTMITAMHVAYRRMYVGNWISRER